MNKEYFKFKCTLTYNANFKEYFSAIKILKVFDLDSTYLRAGRILVIPDIAFLRQDQNYQLLQVNSYRHLSNDLLTDSSKTDH